jgi:hypothetical protein
LPSGSTVNAAIRDIKSAVAAVPTGGADPANLRALFFSISEIGDTRFGKAGAADSTVLGPGISPVGAGEYKCNLFASTAYAVGAGLGWGTPAGVPITHRWLWSKYSAPSADMIADPGTSISNFNVASRATVGYLAGFKNAHGGEGHAAIFAGGGPDGLVIYAGPNFVKVQSIPYVLSAGDEYPTFRRYSP